MKDLTSYEKHNSEYETNTGDVEFNKAIYKKYDEENQFENLGFKKAIEKTTDLPKIHIDIGSGTGWLLRKTSPYFEKVIGIEPSKKATNTASKILEAENISFMNKDMVDGIKDINPTSPVFITTSTVLNHIKNFYVSEFLSILNNIPDNSVIYLDERYGKNIQWNLWYIRSKEWWAKNLPEWQLEFFALNNEGYKSGIYGIKVGKQKVSKDFKMNFFKKIFWIAQGYYYKTKRILMDLVKKIVKNK